MAELGHAADAQVPSLTDLGASADRLDHLLTQLKPFSESTQVNLRSLGAAARAGRPAVQAATPVVGELNRFAAGTPELAKNLNIVLSDLDNRGRAVEKDPRSPGGQGYTGFEALLQYPFDQALSINAFDAHGYMLKANLFTSECSDYQNADSLKAKVKTDPGFYQRCASILGPNQQGVLQPDPTAGTQTRAAKRPAHKRRARRHARHDQPQPGGPAPAATPGPTPTPGAGGAVGGLVQTVQGLLGGNVPNLPKGGAGLGSPAPDPRSALRARGDVLDYLLSP
jgi:hypothetical protein